MKEKYLPIGSICNLKTENSRVMITGYLSVSYKNSLKIYDYKGCVYPEGLLLPDKTFSFNHEDIRNVEFVGYTTPQSQILSKSLKLNSKLNDEMWKKENSFNEVSTTSIQEDEILDLD